MRDGDGVKPFVRVVEGKPAYHPACLVLPEMGEAEFRELAADIAAHGQRHPIFVDAAGVILDGRHRWRALAEAGREAELQVFDGSEAEKVALIVSENVRRRHLTAGQRKAIAAELANLGRGGLYNPNGFNQYQTKVVKGSNDPLTSAPPKPVEKEEPPAVTITEAAQLMGVSPKSVVRAKKVMREDPAAHEAAKRGEKPKKDHTGKKTKEVLDAINKRPEASRKELEEEGFARGTISKAFAIHEAANPPPLPELSLTAQQKLEAWQRKLEADFDYRVRVESQKLLDEFHIPSYLEKLKEIEQMLNWPRNAVMTKVEYNAVMRCLHPDGLHSRTEEQLAEAFRIFTRYKPKMVADDEWKSSGTLPRTREEMLARKAQRR